jgi:YVTN family beta-propeller protein
MGVSPDRRRLVVSDSTSRQVIEFSMVDETLPSGRKLTMGERLRTFESGDTPHENNYSADGRRIFHASIGRVYTPGDESDDDGSGGDTTKGDRWLQIVRNGTFKVRRRWDMGKELAEAGHPDMSSAVRPVAITPSERIMYAQVSFFHGLVEFNMAKRDRTGPGDYELGGLPEPKRGVVTRIIRLPIAEKVKDMPREEYVLDSAHHGLAINHRGTKLCVAGTMSDYAAIVDRKTFTPKVFKGRGRYTKPYWAVDGPKNTCWLSMSGSDLVTVINFAGEKVVGEVPVGDHPQRVRQGRIRESIVAGF